MTEIWRGARRRLVCQLRPVNGVLGLLGSRDHVVLGSGLRRLIAEHTAYGRLEQMPIEFHVVAVEGSPAELPPSHTVRHSKRSWRPRRFPLSYPLVPGRAVH